VDFHGTADKDGEMAADASNGPDQRRGGASEGRNPRTIASRSDAPSQ
jgi:hypothetical protein